MAEADLSAAMQGLAVAAGPGAGTSAVDSGAAAHNLAQQQQQQQEQSGLPASGRVAGSSAALQLLRELVGWPTLYAREGAALGVRWPRGLLLHGPPGCGKTLMVQAVAEEFGAALHVLVLSRILGAYVGESERSLREVFEAAAEDAAQGRTAIVFMDEVDALCPRRDSGQQHEARLVAQLLTLLDGAGSGRPTGLEAAAAPAAAALSGQTSQRTAGHLVVIGATNRPNALDPALRRPGRLDREVLVSVPDAEQREAILRLHTQGLQLSPELDLAAVAASCHGYSGADMAALAREAAMQALSSVAEGLWAAGAPGGALPPAPAFLELTHAHFAAAAHKVGPSIVRGAEAEFKAVSWDDVGGLDSVKRKLRQAVEWPLQHADAFRRLGLTAPRGVLLHGPPGCSKTTLARAAASASGATLLALSCAQLFSMYVGEGEALLRDSFKRARLAAPSIIFLDELDAIAGRREEGGGGGGPADGGVRLLSALLTEMDGIELATGVLVLAATNRPGAIDSALLRPGRFNNILFVPPPDSVGRLQILRIHCRAMPLAGDVDLLALAQDTELFTGAELAALCREAALCALREGLDSATHVAARHFAAARGALRPALTPELLRRYASWGAAAGPAASSHA